MPMYHKLGDMPAKRHTQFRQPDGSLYVEEVLGLEGFSGNESILYHRHSPCRVEKIHPHKPIEIERWVPEQYAHRHLRLAEFPAGADAVRGRQPLLYNNDVVMSYVRPSEAMDFYYRNGQADELIFIHEGKGVLRTTFGRLPYGEGDYLVIPRGTTYQFVSEHDGPERHLIFETPSHFEVPKEFRNDYGQLCEHAPYYHRDIRVPEELEATQDAACTVLVKVADSWSRYDLDYHPFDVVGWDGYCYPWALNIADYEPRAGRIHLPPTSHLTFRGRNFVVCSFVPRMMDWDENAIPIPYHHSNLDSEEVIYYVNGDFMSRKGIERSSVTVHPSGLPHGPQPGAVEASLGMARTDEWAVMIDTFKPLYYTRQSQEFDDPAYMYSWFHDAATPGGSQAETVGSITG